MSALFHPTAAEVQPHRRHKVVRYLPASPSNPCYSAPSVPSAQSSEFFGGPGPLRIIIGIIRTQQLFPVAASTSTSTSLHTRPIPPKSPGLELPPRLRIGHMLEETRSTAPPR